MKPKKTAAIIILCSVLLCICLLVCSFFLLVVMGGLSWKYANVFLVRKIKSFTPELTEAIKENYDISIPETAVFLNGAYGGFNDTFFVIYFECPCDPDAYSFAMDPIASRKFVCDLLSLRDQYGYPVSDTEWEKADWYEEMGGRMDWMLDCTTVDFRSISYSIREGRVLIRFVTSPLDKLPL